MIVTSTASSIVTSAVVVSASNKAAVAGRTAGVWWCSVVGPAQAVADDPQQFLGFGVSIGNDSDGEGTARAALIVTSCVRLGVFIVLAVVAKQITAMNQSER